MREFTLGISLLPVSSVARVVIQEVLFKYMKDHILEKNHIHANNVAGVSVCHLV